MFEASNLLAIITAEMNVIVMVISDAFVAGSIVHNAIYCNNTMNVTFFSETIQDSINCYSVTQTVQCQLDVRL